jgi:biotin carboxylase
MAVPDMSKLSLVDGQQQSRQAVVLVDPYSTGCLIGKEISKRGYSLIALWTAGFSPEMKTHVPLAAGIMNYIFEYDQPMGMSVSDVGKTITSMANNENYTICAVLAGGEAGVDLADALSENLNLLSNGTDIPNRRDKKIQQDLIKQVGLRSVRQACGTKFDEVEDFLKIEPFPVVLKPTESAGSDGVKLCTTFDDAKEHFDVLMKSQMINGGSCPAVLCQEFLRGKEYVVDHVSRNGVHKTMMVYVYDKRPANGATFVYFGQIPIDSQSEIAKILIPYTRSVLDALGFKNGPSHGEIMMTDEGPCLVEMNCRAHGGDGNWRPMCRALTGGYSQVEAAVDAYLDPPAFDKLPSIPPSPFKAAGEEIILVSYGAGTVKSTPGFDVIKCLPSFLCLESSVKPGVQVEYTVDLVTCTGSVILMHPDREVLNRDIEFIRHMERINGIFMFETKLENLKRPRGDDIVYDTVSAMSSKPNTSTPQGGGHRRVFSSEGPNLIRHMSNDRPELRGPLIKRMTTVDASNECVVLIDPYSTGCVIAEEIQKRGYTIMAVWTKGFTPIMKTHVPLSVGELKYIAEVDEQDTLADTASAVYKAAGKLRVVACIAGGEAGVDLADALSEKLKVRGNGTNIPNKRDKKLQQELIKKRGLRSVRQACGSKFEEVEAFLKTERYPVVLKPNESAGSDGVKLCHNFDEAKEHFEVLMNSQMINGGACPAVLCQEFLRGKEYVVDHVSRDGKHKTMMVYVYDKRPANGSAFVYFGSYPIPIDSPEAKILIPYVRHVLDAIEIKNGPSHAEVMMTNDGPCLVEMNCRAHGGDGNWRPMCLALNGGYSQVESTVDAYLDVRQFTITPDLPPSPFKAAGGEVIMVSYARGVVKATPGWDAIKKLESFVYLETGVRIGSFVDYTIDLFTSLGSVILLHNDPTVLEADIETIRRMERENALFEFEQSQTFLRASVKNATVIEFTSDRLETL